MHRYKFENFLKEVFLDSDTDARAGELRARRRSREHDPHERADGAHARARERHRRDAPPASATPSSARASRAGSTRSTAPRERLPPDSWKGYTVGDPLAPSKCPWRMDDEKRRLPRLRAHREERHPHRLRPQGPGAARLRDDLPALALRAWSTTWARPRATGRSSPSSSTTPALKPFLTSPDESLAQFERTRPHGLGDRPRRGPREVRRDERLRRARHLVRELAPSRTRATAPRCSAPW